MAPRMWVPSSRSLHSKKDSCIRADCGGRRFYPVRIAGKTQTLELIRLGFEQSRVRTLLFTCNLNLSSPKADDNK